MNPVRTLIAPFGEMPLNYLVDGKVEGRLAWRIRTKFNSPNIPMLNVRTRVTRYIHTKMTHGARA